MDDRAGRRRTRRRATAPQGSPARRATADAEVPRSPDEGAARPGTVAEPRTTDAPNRRKARPANVAERAAHPGERTKGSGERSRQSGDHDARKVADRTRSVLGVDGALRARDVARPTDEDLAQAEATLHIVRRQWTPPRRAD